MNEIGLPEGRQLLIGCGNSRERRVSWGTSGPDFSDLVTLDLDEAANPDVVHDLESLPYPFDDNEFAEIHAYDVLEHTGSQGDFRFFFAQFSEFYRILKPDGVMVISVPAIESIWLWGDPGHKRAMPITVFVYLNQAEYQKQVGVTQMTDYRSWWHGDFEIVGHDNAISNGHALVVVLRCRKPSLIAEGV